MKKKGFIGDYSLYLILMFVLSLALLAIYLVVDTFSDAWAAAPGISGIPETIVTNFSGRFANIWDFWFLLLAIGFVIAMIIVAVALRSHPVFAVFAIFIMIILSIITFDFANTYDDVAKTDSFVNLALNFPFMTYIMQNLPKFFIGLGTLFLIVLYAKSRASYVNL